MIAMMTVTCDFIVDIFSWFTACMISLVLISVFPVLGPKVEEVLNVEQSHSCQHGEKPNVPFQL